MAEMIAITPVASVTEYAALMRSCKIIALIRMWGKDHFKKLKWLSDDDVALTQAEHACNFWQYLRDVGQLQAARILCASVARLADGEAVDVPSNIQRHAFKNTPEHRKQW